MKKYKRILAAALTFVMLINTAPLFGFAVEESELFDKICPICGEECGFSIEPRVPATCTEAAYVSVHCYTINDFAWMQYGQPDSERHENTKFIEGKPATCTEAGYTDGEFCKACGNWACGHEELPAAGHQWTDWKVMKQPTDTACGQKTRTCTVCEKIETEIIPVGTVSRFIKSINLNDIQMNYKDNALLNPTIVSADGAKTTLKYESSAPAVVSVNDSGNITALKTGSADITVYATDADGIITKDTCTITVEYAWWQWIIEILLLGFLWY